ncbi:MAG: fumarylacetoacetate hydrolase family protein [Trueperaceae bacterium]
MKFLTYLRHDEERLAVVAPDRSRAIDVVSAGEALGAFSVPRSMLELVTGGNDALNRVEDLLRRVEELPPEATIEPGGSVLAPIPRPRKNLFAVGLNYVRHTREFTGSDRLPDDPIIFTKAPTSVVGPNVAIELRPDLSSQVDYEGELGVVIGRRGRDIPAERAEEHIFGYTIINDVTARDLQKRTSQWFLGKSLDTFCPMGPYLVHKSAVGWPVKLGLRTIVNGEVRQDSNTELLYFDIPTLIATISAGITLEPGDVIATGTPEGVGMGFDPPKFLMAGDVVEIEIEGLGALRNPVR